MRQADPKVVEALLQREIPAGDRLLEWGLTSKYGKLDAPLSFLVPAGILGFAFLSLVTGIGFLALGSLLVIVWSFLWFFLLGRRPFLLAVTEARVLVVELSADLQSSLDTQSFLYNEMLPINVAHATLGPSTLHLRPAAGDRIMLGWSGTENNGPRMERLLQALQSKVGAVK